MKKFFVLAICLMAFLLEGCNPNASFKAQPFSVSPSKQVYFSSGNLQYHPVNNEWRFAETQFDYIGDANVNCSSTYNGWLDLFGSTTSVNFGVSTSTNYREARGIFIDWGTNQIGNDVPNTWRTLETFEWKYVVFDRPNARYLRGVANVNGVNGLVLLPDTWACPSDITFKPGFHSEYSEEAYAQHQTFTADQWSRLEHAGAVFLPAAGGRDGSDVLVVQALGYYWSTPLSDGYFSHYLSFNSGEATMQHDIRYYGFSVRLVKDVAPEELDSSAGVQHNMDSSDSNVINLDSINVIDPEEPDSSAGVQHNINSSDSNVINVDSINMVAIEEPNPSVAIGVFSVSTDKQVAFSSGNLQYTQTTKTWSFANSQWEMLDTDNVTDGTVKSDPKFGYSKSGTALADKVDLFCWSTSATNFGVSASKEHYDYRGSFVDWGTNKIGNDAPNTWRTLTSDEWNYLRNNRPNASSLRGVAQVNGVNGLIFLPDNWTCPAGLNFVSGFHCIYGIDSYAAYQTFTAEQWSKLEAAGAVFLPAAGIRIGTDANDVRYYGYYWSATEYNSNGASCLNFGSVKMNMNGYYRNSGLSVRLVKDL